MTCAIVSADNAALHQGARKGVHQILFMELIDGTWAAPAEMVELIPNAFSDYTIRFVADSEFVLFNMNGSEI